MGYSFTIVPGQWDDQANAWLSRTRETGYTLDKLREDVEQGRAALFTVYQDDEPRAAIILSPVGDTLEIWGFAGRVGGLRGVRQILAAVELIAQQLGLSAVWLQTARRGLTRWVQACGYHIEAQAGGVTRLKNVFQK
jgi:hypothetical protein